MSSAAPEVELMWSLRCPDGKLRRDPVIDQFFPKDSFTDCGREECPGGKHECVAVLVDKPLPKVISQVAVPSVPARVLPPVMRDPIEYAISGCFVVAVLVAGTSLLWVLFG